ncbi:beta-glucosidase [Histoplasma capsulatum G186AR]|uniref:Probable beta-glucosidase btgE n=2 Tax=Ajellomyces capsulatus TaxID=5037 RepID=C0NDI4_AJECG|nr:beta-glucosidase [Histoplasma capsulatum G186AR]EEH10282.1 beta-glucosidase [Histoplasma capsulatum G186AR]
MAGSALAHVGHPQHNAFHQRRAYPASPIPSDSTYEASPAPTSSDCEASSIPQVTSYDVSAIPITTGYEASPIPNTTGGYEVSPIPSDSPEEHSGDDDDCACITKVITYYGEPSEVEELTTTIKTTSTSTKTVTITPEPELPTPSVTVFPTPGTYTIPETTITVTKETTVCAATSTAVSPGEHTYGGVTTVVTTATTVTCNIAVTKPAGETVISVIEQTTYVCPSAGTYTVAPSTTSVAASTVFVYPTPATYTTGTYTQPAQTVTVTETDYVYICPAATGNNPAPSAYPTSQPPPPKEQPKEQPKQPEQKPPAEQKPPVLGGGEKWGMTYSPYTNNGQCKGAAAVAADIALIKLKGFRNVRVYATDCDTLQNVGNACKLNGLRMILGVFVSSKGIQDAKNQVDDIVKWGHFDMVDLIVVGNEALHQGTATPGSLAELLDYARGCFKGAGYNGPITTTEPLNKWQEAGKTLCPHIDVIGANIHCFFNPNVVASECGNFIQNQMKILGDICPGKEAINLETGWPSGGSSNGKAIASPEAQATAIKSIVKVVGSKSVFFSFTNDLWKNPGYLGVEQFWGCGDLF